MNLNQVTVEVADIPRARAFYQRLGLELIVSSDHYARFLCPGGATFSIHLAEAPAPGGTLRMSANVFSCDSSRLYCVEPAQMPTASTLTSASPGPGRGTGTSSST